MSETGPSVRSTIARVAGAIGMAGALGLGLDQGKAHAEDPTAIATTIPAKTPTPGPTASPTPDATRTAQEAISRDLDVKIKQELERIKQEEEKKAFDNEIAAKQARLDALTTPTATSTPPPTPNAEATAAAEAKKKSDLAQFQRDIEADVKTREEAAAKAQAAATPPPPIATPGPGEPGGSDPVVPQPTAPAGTSGFDLGKLGEFAGKHWPIGAGSLAVLGMRAAFPLAAKKAKEAVRRRREPASRLPSPNPEPDAEGPPRPRAAEIAEAEIDRRR